MKTMGMKAPNYATKQVVPNTTPGFQKIPKKNYIGTLANTSPYNIPQAYDKPKPINPMKTN